MIALMQLALIIGIVICAVIGQWPGAAILGFIFLLTVM